MKIWKYGISFASFVCALGVTAAAPAVIDTSSLKGAGVETLKDFSDSPKNGELARRSIQLPEYKSVLYFSTDGRQRFLSSANRIFPWAADSLATMMDENYKPDAKAREPARQGLMALFELKDGSYLQLQGVCGPETMSILEVADDGSLSVKLMTFGSDSVEGDFPLLAWSRGKDIYSVFHDGAVAVLESDAVKGRAALRHTKAYPEMFNYLGWCSWEQYRRSISSDLLVESMQQIEASEVPIRWVLVDDGHQHQTGFKMGDSRILSFKAHPETFPQGFNPLMDLKSEKIKWMGIWHAMNGQWQGLHPDHEIDELRPYLMPIDKKKWQGEPLPLMMPKGDKASSQKFYDALIGSATEHGFDFVKIDNQNRQIEFYAGKGNPVETVANHAQSLEAAAKKLSGGLVNCFCADLLSVYNTKYSAVSRVSVDYLLNNEPKAKSHLFQSYQNTLWMGQLVWPDHDMFHSCDPVCGRMMAVSKAVAGAPIYVSDAATDFVPELISPLCWKDGRLLRPLAPAVPLPDSVMLSALEVPQAYRVIAPLPHGAASIVSYNLSKAESVIASITAADYTHAGSFIQPSVEPWKIPAEGLFLYDWYEQSGTVLNTAYPVELTGLSDKLVHLCPIKNGWAMVGNIDKYLCPATVLNPEFTQDQISFSLVEGGKVAFYLDNGMPNADGLSFLERSDGLWVTEVPDSMAERVVISRRD
ncbi:hypothetical protein PDESU_01852 [Pontiella desulfatans]|uniref:Raffinose synthase or seed inhibition protein Sip1 n=1 Tax=Pontiella desulfatans TaxID=2750659 RepID=A0A6C2U1N6_PONDE|nr:Sip1-related alpha-galactosidase [Pontiella desulfatans]VGO13296.1 hypothetical protein PDESU_01852 [Pontiella desulfatans]